MERWNDSTKYAPKFTDEVVLSAMEEILKKPSTTASKVAKLLHANPVHMRRIMLDMKARGLIEGDLDGKTWDFRLKE